MTLKWSLIAGRLPGRTANDLRNYWNTHLRKLMTCLGKPENEKPQDLVKVEVVRSRPRTISKNFSSLGVEAYRDLNESREPRVHDVPPNRSPWIDDDFELRSETTEAWLDGADSPSMQQASGTGRCDRILPGPWILLMHVWPSFDWGLYDYGHGRTMWCVYCFCARDPFVRLWSV